MRRFETERVHRCGTYEKLLAPYSFQVYLVPFFDFLYYMIWVYSFRERLYSYTSKVVTLKLINTCLVKTIHNTGVAVYTIVRNYVEYTVRRQVTALHYIPELKCNIRIVYALRILKPC